MSLRPVTRVTSSRSTLEGAGVQLRRAFGFGETKPFDPFLLLDDFRNDDPRAYAAGFPWHPHRGIETITYVLAGSVNHQDSLGNAGSLGAGDIQWMTAGSGILHQEMPLGDPHGRMHGFQLWANLPRAQKLTAPRYQDIQAKDIPELVEDDGTRVRVICGTFWDRKGPVEGVAADPRYLDVYVPPGRRRTLPVETTNHAFAYVFEGEADFRDTGVSGPVKNELPGAASNHSLVLFGSGEEIVVQAGPAGVRFLLVSGKPIEEPVAWYGPIVMNDEAELRQAFQELQDGTFIRAR
jgi:redox-sensitive bicupin YhaK (pirin superfamily)